MGCSAAPARAGGSSASPRRRRPCCPAASARQSNREAKGSQQMTATALERRWQVIESAGESEDLASCLTGPNGLELVVEMAHDLRSPLTSILFLAESLRRDRKSTRLNSSHSQISYA